MFPISEIHLDVTSRCNLNCAYCYYYGDHDVASQPDPPAERLMWVMDEAAALGCGEVTLTGGEPLLRDDIVDLVAPREGGTLPGVRVVFFPELGWKQGGEGTALRDQLLAVIRGRYRNVDALRAGSRELPG